MTNRSILITGGAGSIGANLVRLPSDEGYQVRVLDDFSSVISSTWTICAGLSCWRWRAT